MKSKIVVGSRVLILPAFAFDFDGALNEMCEKEVGKMATIYDLFDDGDASAIIDDGEMVRVRDVDVELKNPPNKACTGLAPAVAVEDNQVSGASQ